MSRLIAEAVGVLLLIAATTLLWVEHDRAEQRIGIEECDKKTDAAVAAEVLKRKEIASDYEKQVQEAESQHQRELAEIPGRHLDAPVRLCNAGPVRGSTLPGAGTHANNPPPPAGGTDTNAERDIRPDIERFEATVETVVADCRAAMNQWPK